VLRARLTGAENIALLRKRIIDIRSKEIGMRFTQLHLKHFGKFTDKKIELAEGINLFYGENETGKSTVFSFLEGILFGIEKGRGRATYRDTFRRYEPWENGNYYAGSMRFTSGGKDFLLERNFDKYSKNAGLICENDGEELSVEHGDLDMLLGGLHKGNYANTIAIGQLKAETDALLAGELRNYAANYYATGNSEVDLDKAMLELRNQKKILEKASKEMSLAKQEKSAHIKQEASYVWRELTQLEQEHKEIEQRREQQKQQQKQQQEGAGSRAANKSSHVNRPEKKKINPAVIGVWIVAMIVAFLFIKSPWNYLVDIVIMLAGVIYIWNRLKEKNKPVVSEILETPEDTPFRELAWKDKMLTESITEKRIEYRNLQERLEELSEQSEDYKVQDKRKQGIDLAIASLLELSSQIHGDVGEKLNTCASEILREITDGKYQTLWIDENLSMNIWTGEQKVEVEQLSRGTLEQIYFALRMAASEILYTESYPVILDDTFAYYDAGRMERTLRWLAKNKKQVLLFTCHKREGEFLDRCGLGYRLCGL
jgi:Uncharacterized conserved protein